MTNIGQPHPPAGWFDDPAGTGGQRWWNGTEWTEHTAPSATAHAYSAAPDERLHGARVYNAFIWIIALLPVLTILLALTTDYSQLVTVPRSRSVASQLAVYSNPAIVVSQVLGFVVYFGTVLLAYFDWRALKRTGYARPFHWAWAFLTSGVYVIGRSVVMKRRAGRGLLPIWVWAGLVVIGFVVTIARVIPAVVDTVSNVPSIGA